MLIDIHERIKKLNKEQFKKKSTSYKKQKKKEKEIQQNQTKNRKLHYTRIHTSIMSEL